jgi:sugar O-acyltransferase (sialic acid O-acetyltransferase NeuD family)
MNKVILQGGGDHARVVLDCLLTQGADVRALFDPRFIDTTLFGIPQRGVYDETFEPDALAVVAIGDNEVRRRVAGFTRHAFTNALHPSVIVSKFASMGTGNMLIHRAVIQAQAVVGNHVIVNTGAQVDHDCHVGDYVHLAPGVVLCGTVTVGEGAFVGAGAVVLPGRKIGAWATVGAGAVVREDVPAGAVAVGNPARIVRQKQL